MISSSRAFTDEITKVAEMIEGFTPFHHQRALVTRFEQNNGQLVVAHGTGSGKTLGSAFALEEGRKKGSVNRVLVITPSGLRTNYARAVGKWTDQQAQIIGNKQEVRKKEAVDWRTMAPSGYQVISINMFRRDPVDIVQKLGIDTVVFDEVHKARNPYGATHKALMAARPYIRNVIAMTASESSNHPQDIIPLIDFAFNGEHPFGTQTQFKRRYFERVGYEEGIRGGKKPVYDLKPKKREELQKRMSRFVDFVDVEAMDPERFPDKDIEVIPVEMSRTQKMQYDYAMQQAGPIIHALVKSGAPPDKKDIGHIFSALQYARAVSNSTAVMSEDLPLEEAAQKTPKLRRILDDAEKHIDETPDGQIIIYSNLINGGADVIMAGLKARGISYGIFLGKGQPGSSEEERQAALDKFRKGEHRVIVVSGAGTEGIDLPDTTLVQIADGHYNPEVTRQAEARGVRAGGLSHRPPDRRTVRVKRYVSTKKGEMSVDQWVYGIAARKEGLIGKFREVLRATNPKVYRFRERVESKRAKRMQTVDLDVKKIETPTETEGLGRSLLKILSGESGEVPSVREPHKYIARWRGSDGEYRYRYPKAASSGFRGALMDLEKTALSSDEVGLAAAGIFVPPALEHALQEQKLKKVAPKTLDDVIRKWVDAGVRAGDVIVTKDTFKRGPGHSILVSEFNPKKGKDGMRILEFATARYKSTVKEEPLDVWLQRNIGDADNPGKVSASRWRHMGPVIRSEGAPPPERVTRVARQAERRAVAAAGKGKRLYRYDISFGLSGGPKNFCTRRGGRTYCTHFAEKLLEEAGGPRARNVFATAYRQIQKSRVLVPGSPAFKHTAPAATLAVFGAHQVYAGIKKNDNTTNLVIGGSLLASAAALASSAHIREVQHLATGIPSYIVNQLTRKAPYLKSHSHIARTTARGVIALPFVIAAAVLLERERKHEEKSVSKKRHKYIARWRGPDGEYRYRYPKER